MPQPVKTRGRNKLTAAFVKNVTKPGKYHDGGGTGLYLRVDKTIKKYWIQRVTINGKRSEIGLGSPPIVTLAMARVQAEDNKRLIRSGRDPLAEKRKTSKMLTFEEATDKYMGIKSKEFRSDKYRKQWNSTIATHAIPKIGSMSVNNIDVTDILRVLKPIWLEKPKLPTDCVVELKKFCLGQRLQGCDQATIRPAGKATLVNCSLRPAKLPSRTISPPCH